MGSVKNTTDLIPLPTVQCWRCRMRMVVTQFFCCLQDPGPRLFAHMVYTCAIQHIRNSRTRNACFACNVETVGRYLIGNILFLRSHKFSRYKLGLDCHPEPIRFAQGKLREGSASPDTEILRCAQDDSQDPAHVLSREVFSPNVCAAPGPVNVPEKCVMYLAPARCARRRASIFSFRRRRLMVNRTSSGQKYRSSVTGKLRFVFLSFLTLLVVALAACGGSSSTSTGTPTARPSTGEWPQANYDYSNTRNTSGSSITEQNANQLA